MIWIGFVHTCHRNVYNVYARVTDWKRTEIRLVYIQLIYVHPCQHRCQLESNWQTTQYLNEKVWLGQIFFGSTKKSFKYIETEVLYTTDYIQFLLINYTQPTELDSWERAITKKNLMKWNLFVPFALRWTKCFPVAFRIVFSGKLPL